MSINPFSVEDGRALVGAINELRAAIPLIHKLESCGEDCQDYRQRLDFYSERLEKLRNEFFDGIQPKNIQPGRLEKDKKGGN